ncbi:preprotein translocase subunit SecG [Bergeyella sp. RCAD1439]|uniref:preprotein translocase subunit SecG n=1 Tax=Bergeyella anatis TaxID=3113737 RepID=UPI002E179C69|nr:preprotein translocase subunit SecG [Bergeyella sp. RCAD1439]
MSTIFYLFMVLIMIACLLLIIVVMAQNPKGGGLSSTFGGSGAAQFGVQRTNDFMEKSTWTLGTTIVVLIVLSVVLTAKPSSTTKPAPVQQSSAPAQQTTAPASQQAPAGK